MIKKSLFLAASILLLGSCSQTTENKSSRADKFQVAMVDVELKDSNSVFILLAKDGTVNRKGDLNSPDKMFFIGMSQDSLFDKLMLKANDALFSYCDQVHVLADTTKRVNKIKIGFSGPEGDTGFEYYTDEPVDKVPAPILDFIRNAIQITDPWVKSQQGLIKSK